MLVLLVFSRISTGVRARKRPFITTNRTKMCLFLGISSMIVLDVISNVFVVDLATSFDCFR